MRRAGSEATPVSPAPKPDAAADRDSLALFQPKGAPVALSPAKGARRDGANWIATSDWPWLTLETDVAPLRGLWLELDYAASFLDRLSRPCLRFETDGESIDHLLCGPLFGRARWIGQVPKTARKILISPTMWSGRFGFEIERARVLKFRQVAASSIRADVRQSLVWFGAKSIGLGKASGRALRQALTTAPIEDYDRWRKQNRRAFDPKGLDAPRFDWKQGPEIRFATVWRHEQHAWIDRLLGELAKQPWPRWSLAVVADSHVKFSRALQAGVDEGRVTRLAPDARLPALAEGLEPDDLVGRIGPGDQLCEGALAILGEFARLEPGARVIYCDEDRIATGGKHTGPVLKPDWSPIFQSGGHYLGNAIFARARALSRRRWDMNIRCFVETPADVPVLAQAKPGRVAHVRRVVLSCSGAPSEAPAERRTAAPAGRSGDLLATIVIPNKDRVPLLSACLDSLKQTRIDGRMEIIVVDNGSTSAAAEQYYAQLRDEGRARLVYQPGPFNFSALCNAGAREARAPHLVFLNNDTVAHKTDWLTKLLAWSAQPAVGAVGAKLVYEAGHVQHAGIVLGMDLIAGHVGYKARGADPGYLGRFQTAHELSAVTGACLVVEKAKFDAVGGFDAGNLPVELSDVDLCLRLEERGWVTVLEPEALMIHHESLSRGRSLESHLRYEKECAYFKSKWARRMRDDPWFHPALSLDSSTPALG